MKNNRLCTGLALLVCTATMPACAQPGSSGAVPAQTSTSQGSSVGVSAKAVLGLAVAGLGVYGLYRLYNRWSARHEDRERTERLHDAVKRGDVTAVQALLQAGADVSAADCWGYTPLGRAAEEGHEAVVRVLLDAGTNVKAADERGCTPLHWAAGNGHYVVVRALLDAGANVDALGGFSKVTPLCWAAEGGYGAVVRALLEAGADVNAGYSRGMTPLHGSAKFGHAGVVQQLLAAGAKVNDADNFGWTPLYWAVRGLYEGAAQVLGAYGAIPLTSSQCELIVSRLHAYPPERGQQVRARLNQLQPVTEQASLERKYAIESALDEVKIDSERLPRDLQELIIKMSEHPDVLAWWQQNDRLRAMSRMRLPDELLEYIVTFDSPQDIRVFQNMLE